MSLDKPNALLSPADVPVASDVAGLARLRSAAHERSPEALEAVARQFESLFLQMMLQSMRDASLGDGLFDSDAGELYQGMFDEQVALDMARGKGLGIAQLLIRQLAPAAAREPAKNGDSPHEWSRSPTDFVREILPHARDAARQLGLHPLSLVAQAALETGWGKRVIAREDGTSTFNLFGIKAGQEWPGATANARTLEIEDGLPVRRSETFRSYGSVAESFADYVRFLKGSARYREVLQSGVDPQRFAETLGRSGYATDPAYADKIKGLIGGAALRDALASLKNPEGQPI